MTHALSPSSPMRRLGLLILMALAALALVLGGCKDKAGVKADADHAGLYALIAEADAAIAADDMEKLFRISTPDPMMDAMLEAGGATTAEQKAAMREQMEALILPMFESIDITAHDVDTDNINFVTTASGAEIAYVPMSMTMNMGGMEIGTTGQYIGIQREGEWFLLTPSDAQSIAMMKAAFPELEGQDIQPNTMG